MSKLNSFFKQNKKDKNREISVALSDSFVDEDGKVLEWVLKPVSGRTSRVLTEAATQVNKKGETVFKQAEYMHKLAVASIAFPDLNNAELQDSYGVMSAEDLLDEMLPTAEEYSSLLVKVNEVNSRKSVDELTEEAKN